jgi:2-methylisocitrate lyase-like PEP mutase family enzyme
VRTVSHSSLVDRVLARLGAPLEARAGAGLVGADAIGPSALLNAAGTGALAAAVPTLVVTTSLKLVPAAAFERLAAPGFEAVPLSALAAVTLGGELVEPAEAGRRAAALAS